MALMLLFEAQAWALLWWPSWTKTILDVGLCWNDRRSTCMRLTTSSFMYGFKVGVKSNGSENWIRCTLMMMAFFTTHRVHPCSGHSSTTDSQINSYSESNSSMFACRNMPVHSIPSGIHILSITFICHPLFIHLTHHCWEWNPGSSCTRILYACIDNSSRHISLSNPPGRMLAGTGNGSINLGSVSPPSIWYNPDKSQMTQRCSTPADQIVDKAHIPLAAMGYHKSLKTSMIYAHWEPVQLVLLSATWPPSFMLMLIISFWAMSAASTYRAPMKGNSSMSWKRQVRAASFHVSLILCKNKPADGMLAISHLCSFPWVSMYVHGCGC